MLSLKQDNIRKRRVDDNNAMKLDISKNNNKYKIKVIQNNTFYIRRLANYLLRLYYLVLKKVIQKKFFLKSFIKQFNILENLLACSIKVMLINQQ